MEKLTYSVQQTAKQTFTALKINTIRFSLCEAWWSSNLSILDINYSTMSMHIRLKRKNQTLFLHAEPGNNFGQIKSRIGEILGLDSSKIMLLANDKKRELVDLATISDQEIQNDDLVYMVFAKENGPGWEDLQVDVLAPFGEEQSSH